MRYVFGDCELSTDTQEFRRDGERVHAEPQVIAVLQYLIEHCERLVTKVELLDEVWGSRFVSESALTTRIKTARQLCGDTGRDQRVIRTVHGRGYRFVADLAPGSGFAPVARVTPAGGGLSGRQAELEIIEAALQSGANGQRATVFVTGPAGIGKSALLAEATELVDDGWHVLRGQALPSRGPVEPYFALLDALSRAGRAGNDEITASLDRVAPTWLAQLPALLQPEQAERLQRRLLGATPARMLREGAEAIEELARTKPVLLVLEDLHWADAQTLDVIELLTHRAEPMPVVALASARSDPSPAGDLIATTSTTGQATHVELGGLEQDALRELVVNTFDGVDIDPELLALVRRRSGGVPLFVLELLRGWRQRGDVVIDRSTLTPGVPIVRLESLVPGSVRQLVEQDLAHLDARRVALLEAAALVGRSFDAAGVAAALEEPVADVDAALTTAARQLHHIDAIGGSRWPVGTMSTQFEFTHDLYRQVLNDRIPVNKKAMLHANVGQALEFGYAGHVDEVAGRLATHFVEAGDHARAVEYLGRVGEQASSRSAFGPATTALLEALGHLALLPAGDDRDREELRVRLALGPALVATRGWYGAEVSENYERALAIGAVSGRDPDAAVARYALATVTELRGEYDRTKELLTPLLTQPSAVNAESQELMACSAFHQGNFEASLQHAQTVLDAWDDSRTSPLMAQLAEHPTAACNSWAALAAWGLGRDDESERFADRAIAIGEDNLYALSTAQVQRAFLHQLRREPQECRQWALVAIELSGAQGYPMRALQAQMLLGWAEAMSGTPSGTARIAVALDGFRSTGARLSEPYFVGLLAEAELIDGDADRAIELLGEALASMTQGSRTFFAGPELHRLMARALMARDADAAAAREHLRAAVASAQELGSPVLEQRALADLADIDAPS